jgi:vitamin B12 transporter
MAGDLFYRTEYEEERLGAEASFAWETTRHTLVTGTEISQGNLDQTFRAGDLYQMMGVPPLAESSSDIRSWAVYLNDTLSLGRWAVTPGARLDHNTVSGSFFSPSLGATFKPGDKLLFRGTVSRGFRYAPLSLTEGGGLFLEPNPDLEAEEVWSYQAGIETKALPGVLLRTTLFLHDTKKNLDRERSGASGYNDIMVNSGELQRRGVEVDLKTEPFYDFSIKASGIYVNFDKPNSVGATWNIALNLAISYDNPAILTARLAGHYEDLNSADYFNSSFDDTIWELNVSRGFTLGRGARARVFITAHNLFDGDQYNLGDTKNPGRWLEGGMEFAF